MTEEEQVAWKEAILAWWQRVRAIVVNPTHGWRDLVHGLSHSLHRRLNPGKAPHHFEHTHLEKQMIGYVVARGWLDSKLLPAARNRKPPLDPVVVAHERVLARIKTWETKLKRAETALRKLRLEETKIGRRRGA